MPRSIDTAIEIVASPQQVWDVLGDFARYPEWNHFLLQIQGEPAVGTQIRFRCELPRGVRMNATATVLKVATSRELRWAGELLRPWLFRAEHYFAIERLATDRITFRHGEIFSGLLLPLAWLILRGHGPPVYEQMNADLKRRCEERI
ncbi:MAG: SRPBCC domain-containing protein [Thiobacillaceae bacterium]